jgi:hypothetical protein
MADTVNVEVLHDGSRKLIVNLTNVSDGTGEGTLTSKVDLSATSHTATLAGGSVATPGSVYTLDKLVLEEIWWTVIGFDGVRIYANRTNDFLFANVGTGEGYKDYRKDGGLVDSETGGTGDVQLQTHGGGAANDGYAIKCVFRKKWSKS